MCTLRCCSSSHALISELTSGKMLGLAQGTLTIKKKDTAEEHFSVGNSFSFGLVLLHWSNVLALKEWYMWSLGL